MAACVLFFLSGQAFVPQLGIEDNEALFAAPILAPRSGILVTIWHSRFPLMLLSYLGTVKTWLYAPVVKIFGTGVWAVREPALLAGAASIWLFYLVLRKTNGERAAVIGAYLLATDTLYLLTTCFDWGPVALQHLLELGGLLLLVRFYQERKSRFLAFGFLLFGLAMWDKAQAIWTLSGIGLARQAVIPYTIASLITWRRIAIAIAGFAIGALPLLLFNIQNEWQTFRGPFRRDLTGLADKSRLLADTAGGQALFGYLTSEDRDTPQPQPPFRLVRRIAEVAGHPRRGWMPYAFCLAVLLIPLARGGALRTTLFAFTALLLAWMQMAGTLYGGGSVHHTILLWPLPTAVVAVSFTGASRRLRRAGIPVLGAVVAVLMVSNLLVTNEYFYEMSRNGAGGANWTDAIFPLTEALLAIPAKHVVCMDWGITDSLRLTSGGRLPVRDGTYPISKPSLTPPERDIVSRMAAEQDTVFVGRSRDFETFRGDTDKFVSIAVETGYMMKTIATISDRYGRRVFEVYRFAPAGANGR